MKPIAYGYKRWSSTGKGHTEERQTELAEEYCHRQGLTLDTKRKMSDIGVSGYSGKNVRDGVLGAFIKAIEAGEIEPGSFLLVEDVDRLSRTHAGLERAKAEGKTLGRTPKTSPEQQATMKTEYDNGSGETVSALARKYGVGRATVLSIVK